MRSNIDIDDAVLEATMRAGPFRTKKEAVEPGLRLLARQAACKQILELRGKLRWKDAPRLPRPSRPNPPRGAGDDPDLAALKPGTGAAPQQGTPWDT